MRNELEQDTDYIREVIINYRGPKRKSPRLCDSESVVTFLRNSLIDNSREQFIVLFLDTGNRIATYSIVGIGAKESCPVDVFGIFQRALIVGASSIIVAHNHPSGNTKPSQEDKNVTRKLCETGEFLRINVLDHIILSDENHFSFSANEMMSQNVFVDRLP